MARHFRLLEICRYYLLSGMFGGLGICRPALGVRVNEIAHSSTVCRENELVLCFFQCLLAALRNGRRTLLLEGSPNSKRTVLATISVDKYNSPRIPILLDNHRWTITAGPAYSFRPFTTYIPRLMMKTPTKITTLQLNFQGY